MRAGIIGFFLLMVVAAARGRRFFPAFIVNQTHRAIVLQFGEPVPGPL